MRRKKRQGKMKIFFLGLLMFTLTSSLYAQDQTVTGTVIDSQSEEVLPGVNILVKGTTIGTSTDAQGNYSLNVPSLSDTLVFSFIGYQRQEVPIQGRSEINQPLKPQAIAGEELVVVGYGTQEKGDVTASISSVTSEDIGSVPVANTAEALKGQVPGVDIQSQGGQPGQETNIRIRGRRSINAGNDPLLIVDGIPFEGDLSAISSQNIASIDVLKDAAATSIYGSRGANGVILISTKKGDSGDTKVSYNGYFGVTEPMRTVDMMNGTEFANYKRESQRQIIDDQGNAIFSWKGSIPANEQVFKEGELAGLANGVSTDWQNLVLDRGNRQDHQLTVSGGSEDTQFMVSGNYFDENALIPTNGFTRYTMRVNLDHDLSDRVRIGVASLLSRSIKDWATNPLGEALRNVPLGQPRDENGELIFLPVSDGLRSNPLFNLEPNAVEDERKFNHLFASVYAELDLMDNLTYRVNFGPDYETRRRGDFLASMTNQRRGAPPTAGRENRETFSYTLENTLNYSTSLGANHEFDVTLLQSIQSYHREGDNIDVRGLPYEAQKFNNLGTAEEILGVGSYLEKWQLASYMGRLNYDYKGKYLFQISGRTDGSSRLADKNKWAFFPGASVGWRIIEEPFMEDADFLSGLKLRASYGVVGNTSIDPYQTRGRLGRSTYAYGDNPGFGYGLNEIPNPNLTWEKTASFDVGIDFGLWDERVSGSIDYYQSRTTDLLLERQLPFTSGYTQTLQNVGETKNTGIEVALNTTNIQSGGFSWTSSFSWAHNTEEIVELFNANQDDVGNEWFIGEPIEVFYDYDKIGIWQKDEAEEAAQFNQSPGEIKVKDQNGDGIINGSDRVILGSDVPDWIGGMTNRFAYKGIDLSVMVNARVGQMIRSSFHDAYNSLFGRYNNIDVDYWTPDNPTNAFPRPNQNQERPVYSSSMSYFDGSYVKIQNITLGYNLPSKITGKLGLSNIRFYGTVQNALTISEYKAYDPEAEGDEDVDATIPTPRLYSFGINVGF
jgi:TonB-linked SusC/RagA family outer membrane protein